MKIKLLLFYFLLLVIHSASAQMQTDPPMRQVLSTTGSSGIIPGWGTIDYTIGEPVVTTESASSFPTVKWLTQGFQQPDLNPLIVKPVISNSPCDGANNGSVYFKVISATGIVYLKWGNGIYDTVFKINNLPPGTYEYYVKDDNITVTNEIKITEDDNIKCNDLLDPYHVITVNHDGINETWIIAGITNYKNNKVSIFNRWGDMVWSREKYDNTEVVWMGTDNKERILPAATYFYLIEREKGNDKDPKKGWVELIR